MKPGTAGLVCMLSLFVIPITAHAESPFSMIGWQFHEYDIAKTTDAIRRAPQYGVNFFIFSHDLFRSVESYLASDPARDPNAPLDYIADEKPGGWSEFRAFPRQGYWDQMRVLREAAADVGIPYYMWVHEFDDIPQRFLAGPEQLNFEHPDLMPYIEARYERLLAALPDTAGLVLTFHESHYKIFRNEEVKAQTSVPERMYRVAKVIYDVCKHHDKQLILRNFFYEPQEMAWCKEALDRLPDDVIVMSKTTCHEFQPFYPADPMHGAVGNKRQIIEIDLGVEKALADQGAYAQVGDIQKYAQRAYDKRLAGMVGRCRLKWEDPFADTHEVNLFAFSRLMNDPKAPVEQILRDWATRRYGQEAGPHVAAAMARTEFINHHGRYHLTFWAEKDFRWSDFSYTYGHIKLRSQYKWTGDPAHLELESELYHPDIDTYRRIVEEKDEVVRQADLAYEEIRQALPHLPSEQAAMLDEDFRFLTDAARVQRECAALFWAHLMYVDEPTPDTLQLVNQAIWALEDLDRDPRFRYGLDPETGHRYNIDQYIKKIQDRIYDLDAARRENAAVLSRQLAAMDWESR